MQENNIEAAKIELCKAWVYALHKWSITSYNVYSPLSKWTGDVGYQIGEALRDINPDNRDDGKSIDDHMEAILDIITKDRFEEFNETLGGIVKYATDIGDTRSCNDFTETLMGSKYKFWYLDIENGDLQHGEQFKIVIGVGMPLEIILQYNSYDVNERIKFLDKWKDNIFTIEGSYDSWCGVMFEQDCMKQAIPKVVTKIEF